jgi:hypothetical protein
LRWRPPGGRDVRDQWNDLFYESEQQRYSTEQQGLPHDLNHPSARKQPGERKRFDDENRLGHDQGADRGDRSAERGDGVQRVTPKTNA